MSVKWRMDNPQDTDCTIHTSNKNGRETTWDIRFEFFLCARHWDFRGEWSQQNEYKFRAVSVVRSSTVRAEKGSKIRSCP